LKIKIVNPDKSWWYQHHVGEEFDVLKIEGKPVMSEFYFLVQVGKDQLHVKVNDAEFVGKSHIDAIDRFDLERGRGKWRK